MAERTNQDYDILGSKDYLARRRRKAAELKPELPGEAYRMENETADQERVIHYEERRQKRNAAEAAEALAKRKRKEN